MADPAAGLPKLGYGLAAMLNEDDPTAARAIRRVYRYEETVLDQEVDVDRALLERLINRYEYEEGEDAELISRALQRLLAAQTPAEPAPEPAPQEHSEPENVSPTPAPDVPERDGESQDPYP